MNERDVEQLKNKLTRKNKLVWDHLEDEGIKAAFDFSSGYKTFLDRAKTEREAVIVLVEALEANGFVNIDNQKDSYGKKVYRVYKNKALAMAVLGKNPVQEGVNLIASHIDSPRLDLKQQPLYEDCDLALFKTHYYGGIRKYHWLAIPLALHGRIVKSDGQTMDITLGESDEDPVFTISDLLPHLAGKLQSNKKLSDLFEGEKLNLLAGSLPLGDEQTKDRFRLSVLQHLNMKYDLVEEDLISAEIEAVPAGRARDIGFDRSMIGAYGQDDRICAFTSLMAALDVEEPQTTAVSMFFDKEETGSEGNTGAKSNFLQAFIGDLLEITDPGAGEKELREALINSSALSADVNAALDPDFPEVHEKRNAAKVGYGVCLTKFTGVAGKSGSNDASAEFVGKVRRIFNKDDVVWQTGELGKVDQGGGGTIAKFLAASGMETVDCGPAILSMHSPMEVSNKGDVYMTYKAYKAFFKS